jgi:trehalose-6-phosphate synthase
MNVMLEGTARVGGNYCRNITSFAYLVLTTLFCAQVNDHRNHITIIAISHHHTQTFLDMPRKGRLIIVSNRLPVSIKDTGHGQYEMKPSSGGLVTGLRGLANSGVNFLWFGWPGLEIPKENVSRLKRTLSKDHKAVPVLLDQRTSELYYNGFSSTHTLAHIRH